MRVRGSYLHHKEVKAAQGIKIAAQNLENAVAGTQMLVVQKGDSVEDLKEEVMGDMTDIFKSVDKSGKHPKHRCAPRATFSFTTLAKDILVSSVKHVVVLSTGTAI